MLILACDLATNSGFAIGNAGEKPRSWAMRLRSDGDDPERAFKRLGIELRDLFMMEKPDLIVVETPISMGGMVERDDQSARGFRFKSRPETIYILTGLVGVVFGIAGPYGIPARKVNVQTVRKHFLGVARPSGDPKKLTVARCHMLGLMARDCKDDNRADAIALHDYAAATFGRAIPAQLILHGETPEPETIESVFGGRAP